MARVCLERSYCQQRFQVAARLRGVGYGMGTACEGIWTQRVKIMNVRIYNYCLLFGFADCLTIHHDIHPRAIQLYGPSRNQSMTYAHSTTQSVYTNVRMSIIIIIIIITLCLLLLL